MNTRIPRKLKRIARVVEKAQLKSGDAACVKDIVRAMSIVDSMADVAKVLRILLDLQEQREIEIVRVKERFLEAPTGGGWRGNMECYFACVLGKQRNRTALIIA